MGKPTGRSVLLRAAELIGSHGWCRGNYRMRGRFCVVGAMMHVDREYAYHDALARLERSLKTSNVLAWNDARERTGRQVIAALRKAAR